MAGVLSKLECPTGVAALASESLWVELVSVCG